MKKIVSIALLAFIVISLVACSNGGVECPSCKKVCEEGTAFCIECGSALGTNCPSCGRSCQAGDSFCAGCGATLSQKSESSQDSDMQGTMSIVESNPDDTESTGKGDVGNVEDNVESSEESEIEEVETSPAEIWLVVREEINKNAVFEYEYDYYGNVVVSIMKPYNDETQILLRTDYTYDANGYLKESKTDNALFGTKSTSYYDIETVKTPKGERISAEICKDANGNVSSKNVYEYNEIGQLIKKEEYYGSTLYMSYEYDPKIEKVLKEYEADGTLSKENIYNDKGQLVEEKTYTSGVLLMRATFTFDNNGNPSKRTGVREDDGSVVESYYVYKNLERYRIEQNLKP